jgi:hypothetical protein
MLMPDKHIRWSESLLGLSVYVLEQLAQARTVDQVWECLQTDIQNGRYPASHSFENLVLSLDALYAIGAIDASQLESAGVLRRCD